MKAWFEHNLHSLGLAARRMTASPFAALFSILVIGVALSLPAGLYVALDNAAHMANRVPARPVITLFLDTGLTPDSGRQLAQQVSELASVSRVRFISRDHALKQLQDAGLSDLTSGLSNNPLPDSIVVTTKSTDPDAMDHLAARLKSMPGVDHLTLDTAWVHRLAALLALGHDLVWLLAGLLGLALAAIVGNTIRLQIYSAREEIEVSRLIGATNRFIRRPFLYFGVLQGLLGGLAGWIIVTVSLYFMESGLARFGLVWNLHVRLAGLGPAEVLIMLGTSSLLGFLGAFFAVGHSLRQIDRAVH